MSDFIGFQVAYVLNTCQLAFQAPIVLLAPLLEELLQVLLFFLLHLQFYLLGGAEGNHKIIFLMFLVSVSRA